jgi:hypothetical protein
MLLVVVHKEKEWGGDGGQRRLCNCTVGGAFL